MFGKVKPVAVTCRKIKRMDNIVQVLLEMHPVEKGRSHREISIAAAINRSNLKKTTNENILFLIRYRKRVTTTSTYFSSVPLKRKTCFKIKTTA